jgi:hypothetical protein
VCNLISAGVEFVFLEEEESSSYKHRHLAFVNPMTSSAKSDDFFLPPTALDNHHRNNSCVVAEESPVVAAKGWRNTINRTPAAMKDQVLSWLNDEEAVVTSHRISCSSQRHHGVPVVSRKEASAMLQSVLEESKDKAYRATLCTMETSSDHDEGYSTTGE